MKNHTQNRIPSLPTTFTRMSGFSMIEMMISITIGLFIVSGLVGLLISSSASSKTNDRTAELQGNGRYALSHLKAILREAGYHGDTGQMPADVSSWVTPNLPATGVECGTAGSFVKNIRQGIWASNDINPFAANCIPAASYLRGDVLVTRNAASTPSTAASAVANTIYLNSSYSGANLYQGNALPADQADTNNFALKEYVYYISPFTNSTATTGLPTENPPVPALYRVALQPDATGLGMTPELVVTGIEHMQLQFGVYDSANNTTQFNNPNQVSVNAADHSTTSATTWDNVISVRIWLLARNSKPEMGYTDNASYTMGDVVYGPQKDNFRREVFTTVVELRNH